MTVFVAAKAAMVIVVDGGDNGHGGSDVGDGDCC